MAKKTISKKYCEHDAALREPRLLQSYEEHAAEIYYESLPNTTQQHKPSAAQEAVPKVAPMVAPPVPVRVPLPEPERQVATMPINVEDVPIQSRDVIVATVAQKLRKPFLDIDCSKSIRHLCGGRSTMENEVIGDLSVIFDLLPDRAEDMGISELSQVLSESTSAAKLTTAHAKLTASIFTHKMPGGFTMPEARKHLEVQWRLGVGRQDAILLRMATEVLPSRLKTSKEATMLLDRIAEAYADEQGLKLQPMPEVAISAPTTGSETKLTNGPSAIHSYTSNDTSPPQSEALVKAQELLNIIKMENDALQQKMDLLTTELGDEFIEGILPAWSPLKIRKYESCWNWALQDLLLLVNRILRGETSLDNSETRRTCDMIVRRSNDRLIDVMRYMLSSNKLAGDELLVSMAKSALAMLMEDSQSWLSCAQTSRFFGQDLHTPMDTYAQEAPGPESVEVKVKTRSQGTWKYDTSLIDLYRSSLACVREDGLRLKGKTVLLTGAGPSSIGRELLQQLLVSGARVLVATSRFSPVACRDLQTLYMKWGSSGSQLVVSPFNQGSRADCESLVQYIFSTKGGLEWDLDFVVPFAAVSEEGQIDELASKSEKAHRIMLTNVLRLLGSIKRYKQAGPRNTSPVKVLLPLSPNHGVFGRDGLYAESKAGLEMLLNKWYSEDWSSYLAICGATIGWVRGTGLMAVNDAVAAEVEVRTGVKTFSQFEMAQHLAALLVEPFASQVEIKPVKVDISGGMTDTTDLRSILSDIRRDSRQDSTSAPSHHHVNQPEIGKSLSSVSPMANLKLDFPQLPDYEDDISPLYTLSGMVDLDRTVVITGMSEVGPWGSSRTRWEMEAFGEFSLEGCIEMAWIMGLITHYNGKLGDEIGGEHYTGWVDAKTKAPVADVDVKARYEEQIIEHAGIRLVEPELDNGYDPSKKQLLHEIVLTRDLAPFAAPPELAKQFIQEHGEKVDATPGSSEDGDWTVRLRKGAVILVPKALRFDRTAAGQIPQGWDARRYGVPDWAVDQIGRETLFALVATAESLLSSGIVDPYELYQYMHVSEVGNCVGSGIGGLQSLKKIFRYRYHDKPVQSDVLQEAFANTGAAWINMLLLSSSGPIRTPVGACATAVESLELGYELITAGKAKIALVGGHDDMNEEVAYEFAKMRATVNTDEEEARGRVYSEMSRPMTTTRDGFVESQGSGIQVLASARMAIEMGLPIYGIVSWAGTASDKTGRSVPSPGKGTLTNAHETHGTDKNPLLDIHFRKDRITKHRRQIQVDLEQDLKSLEQQFAISRSISRGEADKMSLYLHKEAIERDKQVLKSLGHTFWTCHTDISPVRGALSAWGLTIDDLDFVSLHGTSTALNDKNEASVIQSQLSHLGRTRGNPAYCITQKYLTGHSKGAAGAWMINGALQALNTGLIPGNRNADDISPELEDNDFLFFPHHSVQTNGLRAFSVTSFGFGQKGAQAIIVHPRYLYAALSDGEEFHRYKRRLQVRQRQATRFFQKGLATKTLFVAKEKPPYTEEQESRVLLNPKARMEGQHYKDV
ncbi:fatty acid synthase alpha subunit [Fusarium austroafricanum]|uniref:beta-ketoacyl-[acyl-carrier-protein] synthase I n=1 Tax=Fusarium austroafricanum TaxID=2364996 RepID=A0A8H4KV46_9HYPO|nr:fatty acid synthase alpha subunit [Fusarium austroafricanum]